MAGGRQVGKIVEGFAAWEAYLWCEPKLGEVRKSLRERVEQRGPWWGAEHPDGRET
jgi:hypothetical protein